MMQTPHLLKLTDGIVPAGGKPSQTLATQLAGAEFTLAVGGSAPAITRPSADLKDKNFETEIPAISHRFPTRSGDVSPETPFIRPQPADQPIRPPDAAIIPTFLVPVPQTTAPDIPKTSKTEASGNKDGHKAMSPAPIPEDAAVVPPIAANAPPPDTAVRLAGHGQPERTVEAGIVPITPGPGRDPVTPSPGSLPAQTIMSEPAPIAAPQPSAPISLKPLQSAASTIETATFPALQTANGLLYAQIIPTDADAAGHPPPAALMIVNPGAATAVEKPMTGHPSPQKPGVVDTAERQPGAPGKSQAERPEIPSPKHAQAGRIDVVANGTNRIVVPNIQSTAPARHSPDQANVADQSPDNPTVPQEAPIRKSITQAPATQPNPPRLPKVTLSAESHPAQAIKSASGPENSQPARPAPETITLGQATTQQPLASAPTPGPTYTAGPSFTPMGVAQDIVARPNQTPISATPVAPPQPIPQQIALPVDTIRQDAIPGEPGDTALGDFATEATKSDSPRDLARIVTDPKLPRHLGAQLAQITRQMPDGPVELALNPEELGRVRMSLNASDTAITVNLTVERPETADLMRRNLEALAAEFRELGYIDVSFSFSGDTAQNEHTNTGPANNGAEGNDPATDPAIDPALAPGTAQKSGMDLRL